MRTVPFAVFIALASAAQPAAAQKMSALSGRVITDSLEIPVLGAEVTIKDVRGMAITDSLGKFVLFNVPPGKQLVNVRRLGFAPITAVLTFTAGDTLDGEFLLMTTAQRLKGVEVKGRNTTPRRIVEFDERRKSGFGEFIGPEQLATMQSRRTDDVLRLIPGPYIQRSNVTTAAWVAMGRGAYTPGVYTVDKTDINKGADKNKCYATVYVDGVAVFSALPGELLFDINSVEVNTIHGIEFYGGAGTIPPQFPQKRGTCGVLVVWTKY
ncbi:MAG: carboxypeptidase regulatory-like domain-containing protein [Gemmatimonadales bacterium]